MSTTRTLRASTIASSFKAQMSRKVKATPSSSPVRPVGFKKRCHCCVVERRVSRAPKPQQHSAYGERLAHDHPDADFWVPFDNTVSRGLIRYFDSDALPTSDAYEFFDALRLAKPHFAPKTNPGQDLSFFLRLKPTAEVMQALKVSVNGARIALDASFGIPRLIRELLRLRTVCATHSTIPTRKTTSFPALAKGKGKASTSKRPRSPSDDESVPKKRQSRRKAKPNDSDADYVANDDNSNHDELANDAEEPAEPEQAYEGSEAREDEEEEGADDEDEDEEEEEATQAPPKKAAKGAAGGKAQAAPATALAAPVSPLFAGPPSNRKQIKAMPVEQVGHDLVTEASKPPFLNKGPPACTNCISRGHDCKPCITARTSRCQRCNDGHMVCSRGRTAPELLTSFERLRPVLAVAPSALNTALISLVMARRELDLQWIQLTRMSAQYDQQFQELVDIILQQNDGFDAEYVRLFYEDPGDREVLQGLLERALRHTSPEERHRDRYARHPVTPVVHKPKPSVNEPSNSYTRLVPSDDHCISDIDALPNFGAVKHILQQAPGLVPVAPSHPLAVPLTQEVALRAFAKPSAAVASNSAPPVAGPSTAPLFPSPGHTLVGPAVPPSTSAEMEGWRTMARSSSVAWGHFFLVF
ncbi:hypothetical protein B0H14DRAFT_3540493 [Mycena olivaceomarginata]|nr:hypothetical protein B0H14DRAFT_3540493 [Mycena olivaceomarginata]